MSKIILNPAEKAKKWRKNNPDKVKAYQDMRYKRDIKKIRKYNKEWCKKNGDKIIKQKRNWEANNLEYVKICRKTRYLFNHLKKKCQECGETKDIHFHHLEPIAVDNFKILCRRCHRIEHNKLIIDTT